MSQNVQISTFNPEHLHEHQLQVSSRQSMQSQQSKANRLSGSGNSGRGKVVLNDLKLEDMEPDIWGPDSNRQAEGPL